MKKNMIGLDIGDVWTGIATAHLLGISAKPHTTIATPDLIETLKKMCAQQEGVIIVVGKPITLRGTESEQTKKIIAIADQLKNIFAEHTIVLWDERLSSKHAQTLAKNTSKEEKLKSHARAAAFILQNYLDYRAQQQSFEN